MVCNYYVAEPMEAPHGGSNRKMPAIGRSRQGDRRRKGREMGQFARNAARFVWLQISAASFAIILLALFVLSRLYWPEDAALHRYDALLIACLLIQTVLIATGLESLDEAKAIAVYHVVGVVMEVFKVWAGSWFYPEPSVAQVGGAPLFEGMSFAAFGAAGAPVSFALSAAGTDLLPTLAVPLVGGVPLFTGFMYSAVGSYIARAWGLLRVDFNYFPPIWAAFLVALLIYFNFYTHHYIWDWRYVLFAATCILFWRSWLRFDFGRARASLPVLTIFIAVGALIWIAENIATWANVWIYPQQTEQWRPVSVQKIGSWTLLMILSFVLSAALHRPDLPRGAADPSLDPFPP
ncbi:MAG: DUF817 domain-containing protein [Neomegalonema sp.]|nr:DUF817 domain-containing protein [Neomegalonema sp.]